MGKNTGFLLEIVTLSARRTLPPPLYLALWPCEASRGAPIQPILVLELAPGQSRLHRRAHSVLLKHVRCQLQIVTFSYRRSFQCVVHWSLTGRCLLTIRKNTLCLKAFPGTHGKSCRVPELFGTHELFGYELAGSDARCARDRFSTPWI